MDVSKGDLDAVRDVITWLADGADDMTLEQAIEMRDALDGLAKMIGQTQSILEARALKLLDGQPAKIGDKVYIEKSKGVWRPDQSKIRTRVAMMSSCDDKGEMLPPRDAAEKAVGLMYDLFVSPSTMPKQGGMKKLGLTAKDVAHWETTGRVLDVIATVEEKA